MSCNLKNSKDNQNEFETKIVNMTYKEDGWAYFEFFICFSQGFQLMDDAI